MNNLDNKDKIFGVFFLIFFIVLIIMVRTGSNPEEEKYQDSSDVNNYTSSEIENSDDDSKIDIYQGIKGNNYSYTYTVNIDNKKEIITGKVYDNKEEFTIISNVKEKYVRIGDNYFKVENSKYIDVNKDDIRSYFKYIDISNIDKITGISTKDKTTDEYTLLYNIQITDLIDEYNFDIYYDPFEDYSSDKVSMNIDSNKMLKLIEIDYSNYYKFVNSKDTNFNVTLEYSNYGKVEDFDV